MTQDIENWRKRLIFRSDHRGIKEMDIIMGGFARQHVPSFNEKQLQEYEELLQENDPNLYNWITGKDETPAHISSDLLNKIKAQYE